MSRKITALVLLSTLAALTVSAVALFVYSASDYRETRLADVRTQAEVVGRSTAPALAFNDPKDAERDLATLAARPDILRAALYAADGSLFAFYATGGDITPISDRLDKRALGTHGERLTLAYPIIEDGQRLGTLVIDARYGQRARQLAYLAILGGVTLGALLASLLVSSWLQRALVKPIDLSNTPRVLLYQVVNRGNGQAVASPEGYISLVSGWQGDVIPTANNQTIVVPIAKHRDGSPVTGPVIARFFDVPNGATTAAMDRQQRKVLLFANEWEVQYFEKQNPTFALLAESPVA
jgi:hypothetical protein